MRKQRKRLLTFSDPRPLRIDAMLAEEIGLDESIVLLQLEFLITIAVHEHEGRLWTYQTLEGLREAYFPWWSVATIHRTVKSLADKNLIMIGHFNQRPGDRTQWYALNEEGINKLSSVGLVDPTFFHLEKRASSKMKNGSSRMKNGSDQNEKSIFHFGTTLPETSSETSSESSLMTPSSSVADPTAHGDDDDDEEKDTQARTLLAQLGWEGR